MRAAHREIINGVACELLATASDDGSGRVWDFSKHPLSTFAPGVLSTLAGHSDTPTCRRTASSC
jgi:WD40 repeat protein